MKDNFNIENDIKEVYKKDNWHVHKSGLFISVEGGDGAGKSTQIKLIEEFLTAKGYKVIITREPGGTIISEDIRRIILNKEYMNMNDMTEALLYSASRAQHVAEKIIPNLNENKIIICDRYVDSSIAYQGYARGLGVKEVEAINYYATNGLLPNVTFLLDLSSGIGLNRKRNQKSLDRLELQKEEFHDKVIKGFKLLAQNNEQRIVSIDATKDVDFIHNIIKTTVLSLIK